MADTAGADEKGGDRGGGESLSGVIDRLLDKTSDQERVWLDNVFEAFSGRLYGPLLLIPSLALLALLAAAVIGRRAFAMNGWI